MPQKITSGSARDKAQWMFERASIWPDLVRNMSEAIRTRYHHRTWHYINLPVFLLEQDEKELARYLNHDMSTEFVPPWLKDLNIVQALKGNWFAWREPSASDADKAVALCWILHLTGDIHQPLHNVALFNRAYFPEGDRGGNSIAIKRKNDVTNLHAVWDGLANRFDDLSPDEKTKQLLLNDVADIQSIIAWARHQQELAMEFVYTEEVRSKVLSQVSHARNPEISLSAEYVATAEKIARSQVIIAGHRIAALITK